MPGTERTVGYTVALDTITGNREITGTATTYNDISDRDTKAAVAQYAAAGTSTPVKRVNLHPAN